MGAIPKFLELPAPGARTYGRLKKIKIRDGFYIWQLEGESHVVAMAKRIFPGAEGKGQGIAKFPANKRGVVDLVWFINRYPVEIADPEAFQADYEEACAFVIDRERALSMPVHRQPDALFKGVLKEHQVPALDWVGINNRTLIADRTGYGKTIMALAFLATQQKWPALICVPPHLMKHWQFYLNAFLDIRRVEAGGILDTSQATYQVLQGKKGIGLQPANIYLTHYLLLKYWRQALVESGIRRVVFDEIQELRRKQSEKYSAAHEITQLAEDVLGLSATPIYNHGGEMWNVMNVISFGALGDWDTFTREYCEGYGNDVVKDPERLNAFLTSEGLMLRRTAPIGLKARYRLPQPLDHDESVFSSLISRAVAMAHHAKTLTNHLERGRAERTAGELARKATGIAKAPAVAAFVRGLVESGEPVVVFAHHHAVVDILLDLLKEFNPLPITGRQNETQKWDNQQAFIEGRSQVVVIHLRGAPGLDGFQKRARIAVFAELDWSPAVHSQGEERLWRDGQEQDVLCYYPYIEAGSDMSQMAVLGFKISQFVGVMGDVVESEERTKEAHEKATKFMKEVLERLLQMPNRNPEVVEIEDEVC